MVNCPKCGTEVREEKAFCHKCGSPIDAAVAGRETPMPDFGATIIEPPRPRAPAPSSSSSASSPPSFVPPASKEFPPAARESAPASYSPPATAGSLSPPAPPTAAAAAMPQHVAGRKSSRKIGFAFVLLLLFLMFAAFVLALVLD